MLFHRDYASVFLFHTVFWVGSHLPFLALDNTIMECSVKPLWVYVCVHVRHAYTGKGRTQPLTASIKAFQEFPWKHWKKIFSLMCFQLNSNTALQA